MDCFQACLGFVCVPISGALQSFLQTNTGEAITGVLRLATGGMASIIMLNNRAGNLARERRYLRDARAGLEREINRGWSLNMMPTPEAETWLEEVGMVETDAAEFQDSLQRMEGFSLQSRYSLGCVAYRVLKDVLRLKEQRTNLTVLCEKMPDPVVPRTASSLTIVGAEDTLSEIRHLLEDDDLKIIGIYGMGGVGKTTLLTTINNELFQRRSDQFDLVIFITVSNEVRLHRIQDEIGICLGYSPPGPQLPQDPVLRVGALSTALLKKKFLLLLDDLWEKVDLAQVGIPVSLLENGSKIVLATRSMEVCDEMDAQRTVRVPCLNQVNSWVLFSSKLKMREDQWTESTRALATRVAAKCGGLPLALITVGCAMARATTEGEWQEALMQLQGTAAELRNMKDVLTLLKFSFDRLTDERQKNCLLYCSLFPEDRSIKVTKLIEYCVGEGLLDEGSSPCSIDRARNRGHSAITALKAPCLLEDGYWTGKHVKLHDTIREMALWITSGAFEAYKVFLVKSGEGLEHAPGGKKWTEATRISFMFNSLDELPEEPRCQNLQTLLLNNNAPLRQIHGGFFQYMPVLTVLDLSRTNISLLPPEIGDLVELRLLDLSLTLLQSLPREVGRLRKLRLLRLNGTFNLDRIPQEAISSLSCLQSLTNFQGSYVWRGGWKDDGVEDSDEREVCVKDLEGLKQLDELGLSVRIMSLEDLQALMSSRRLRGKIRFLGLKGLEGFSSLDLVCFDGAIEGLRELSVLECLELRHVIFRPNQLVRLETLTLRDLPRATISWKYGNDFVKEPMKGDIFKNLLSLVVLRCDALEDISWTRELPCLETLLLMECPKMVEMIIVEESVMTSMVRGTDSFFPKLRIIDLDNLQNLNSLCRFPLLFPTLEILGVINCPKLKKLPFKLDSAKNIRCIFGDLRWWNGLEWDHGNIRSKLNPCFFAAQHQG